MDSFFHFLGIFALCVTALIVVAVILLVIVSRLPHSPVKDMMRAFSDRMNATAAVALMGLPLQIIPEIDGIYDIGAVILLAYYWSGMVKKIRSAKTAHEANAHGADAGAKIMQLMRYIKKNKRYG